MKPLIVLSALSLLALHPSPAQQPGPPPGARIVRPGPPPPRAAVRFDRAVVRRHLAIVPKVVPLPARPIVTTPVPPPQPTATTTITTTTRTQPRRYNTERNVVIIETAQESRELPYVTVPVLFVKETAELLDVESASALTETANAIKEITQTEPTARFDIEGHTSTDGTDEFNMSLSAARAKRVFDELTQRYGVSAASLSAHGYGENHPAYPNGSEDEMQLDRRVLVVRTE